MTIGIGVEGPSDRAFWDKVLHKHFPGMHFDIRNMKNRYKLIEAAPKLFDTFRDAHYEAGFILLDRDDTPCVTGVIDEFAPPVRDEARKPMHQRYLFVCVAIRELEAWFLADERAIAAVLPAAQYTPPHETGTVNAETMLKELWRQQYGEAVLNKIDFARRIAAEFNPTEAQKRSASFTYFWSRGNHCGGKLVALAKA